MTREEARKKFGCPDKNGQLNPDFVEKKITEFTPLYQLRYDYNLSVIIKVI